MTQKEKILLQFSEKKNVNVNLALSDDLKSASSFLGKATGAINTSIKNYESAYKSMQSESNGAKSVAATQQKLINTVEAKAKELGINPSSIPGYTDANKSWEETQKAIDRVNEF